MNGKEARPGGGNLAQVCNRLVDEGKAVGGMGGAIKLTGGVDLEGMLRVEEAYAETFYKLQKEFRRKQQEAARKLHREHPEWFH